VTPIKTSQEELTMTMLWINVLLAIPFIALWAGIPLWLVLRRPDAKPTLAAAPAVRTMPAVGREDADYRRVA
jgi:hypothetical protein